METRLLRTDVWEPEHVSDLAEEPRKRRGRTERYLDRGWSGAAQEDWPLCPEVTTSTTLNLGKKEQFKSNKSNDGNNKGKSRN